MRALFAAARSRLRERRQRRRTPAARPCLACREPLGVPVVREPRPLGYWTVGLRCSGCGHEWDWWTDAPALARLDRALARGRQELLALDLALFARQADTLIAALAADLIGPEDFARAARRG
jgi:hypothetical protein